MEEKKIKLGIVSNNNLERNAEFKKLLTHDFIDFFEIKSQELNDDLDEFILEPTSLANVDKEMQKEGNFIEAVANNIASAYFSMGLTNFTIDVTKFRTALPRFDDEFKQFLQKLSLAVQEVLFEKVDISITLKGMEEFTGGSMYAIKFLRDVNAYVASYNDDEDARITFSPALIIGKDTKCMPIDIAKAGTVYLTPVRVGKDLSYKEPIVRSWVNIILKAQAIADKPITLFYEDDITSLSSIANLIQMFKPELRTKVKDLGLGVRIDKFSR